MKGRCLGYNPSIKTLAKTFIPCLLEGKEYLVRGNRKAADVPFSAKS